MSATAASSTVAPMPRIVLHTTIAVTPEQSFDLAIDVDAHQASQSRSHERAVAGILSGPTHLNDEVTWEAKHLFRTRRLTSRITAYDRPHRFVDEMVQGDFASLRHEHTFTATDGGTLMTDVFDYTSPYGVLGCLADAAFLRRYMTRLLTSRNSYLKSTLEAAKRT